MNTPAKPKREIAALLAALLLILLPVSLSSQQTGSVSGTVQDALGRGISEANVAVAVASHKPAASTKTDEEGRYRIEGIIPGTYDVTISHPGFETSRFLKIDIGSAEGQTLNATLKVGQPIVDDEHPAIPSQSPQTSAAPQASAAPRTVLFPIVSNCVANQEGTPQCAFVDAKGGYVILKDRRGESQLLLVATARRWGMEDPHIEASDEPNYFEEAWSARRCVSDANGQPAPDSEIGIVINSKYGRSDGQLHLHIDLLKPGIADELHQRFPHPGGVYKKRNETASFFYGGHPYAIAHYETLHGHNLFADLQHSLQRGDEMANHSIMVIEDPAGGFFVLNDRAHGTDRASGEELQIAHTVLAPERFTELAAKARTCMAADAPH